MNNEFGFVRVKATCRPTKEIGPTDKLGLVVTSKYHLYQINICIYRRKILV